MGEGTRPPGLSVRLKLTLSYAGFLMVTWAMFAAVLVLTLRYVPEGNLVEARSGGFVPDRADLLRATLPFAATATAVLAVVGLVGGWLLAGRMLRPLEAIGAAARRAAEGSLEHRVALPGPDDELRRLADDFDHMLARLQRAFEEQRRFTSNASHELRTPHAATRTMLEVARADPAGRDVDRLLVRLSEMNERSIATVDGLLRLARTDGTGPVPDACDLADVLRAAVADVPGEGAAPPAWRLGLQPAPLTADPELLDLLVANLLGNAVRHNAADDAWVRVRTGVDDDRAVLEVENPGPALAREVVPTLVEPFVRGAGRTRRAGDPGGSGLGLAIVASVARAHAADVDLRAREGGGLVVRVAFPAAFPPGRRG